MKTIEIQTPQNVTLEVPLAGVGYRILSFAVDQFALIAFMIILLLIDEFLLGGFFDEVLLFIYLAVYLLYTPMFELMWNGQTLGKRMLGLRVIRLDGSEITFDEVMGRWLMRLPDIYASAGALAVILISSGRYQQRIGDLLAGTIVVLNRSGMGVSLNRLRKLDNVSNYTPKFPIVKRLSEDDALLIKKTIQRHGRYSNEAHKLAVSELSLKLKELLQIESDPETDIQFLNTVLKDYIVLTR